MPRTDLSRLTGFGLDQAPDLYALQEEITACDRCPRLRDWCRKVAAEKRRGHADQTYWGRPVPVFGDPQARILIIGLAPAAHGANRTGRMFTGDSSGDWLYRALHAHGFASQPTSEAPGDGLVLRDVLITAGNRCAPPGNRPTPQERADCLPWLAEEVRLLQGHLRVVLVLGHLAYVTWFRVLGELGIETPTPRPRFAHGAAYPVGLPGVTLLASYHPSRQNTNTGVLTRAMWDDVFARARRSLEEE